MLDYERLGACLSDCVGTWSTHLLNPVRCFFSRSPLLCSFASALLHCSVALLSPHANILRRCYGSSLPFLSDIVTNTGSLVCTHDVFTNSSGSIGRVVWSADCYISSRASVLTTATPIFTDEDSIVTNTERHPSWRGDGTQTQTLFVDICRHVPTYEHRKPSRLPRGQYPNESALCPYFLLRRYI